LNLYGYILARVFYFIDPTGLLELFPPGILPPPDDPSKIPTPPLPPNKIIQPRPPKPPLDISFPLPPGDQMMVEGGAGIGIISGVAGKCVMWAWHKAFPKQPEDPHAGDPRYVNGVWNSEDFGPEPEERGNYPWNVDNADNSNPSQFD
jgi:hypothetical protein